jgi:hypothetical protein
MITLLVESMLINGPHPVMVKTVFLQPSFSGISVVARL